MPIGCARTGTLTVPNTFTNGTVADADQVNANFAAAETAVNDNDSRITTALAAPWQRRLPALDPGGCVRRA
jgi:hypothetical protein